MNKLEARQFLNSVKEICDVTQLTDPIKPTQKHEMTIFWHNNWYSLKWKPTVLNQHSKRVELLDVALLDRYIVHPILKSRQKVEYTEGPKGLSGILEQVNTMRNGIAFCLHPIKMEEIQAIADAGEVLPPKSTWFEPRLKNGLLIKEIIK